jgi:hypothetical protein
VFDAWKAPRRTKRSSLTKFQFSLKKAGPKPSGPGLELTSIPNVADLISTMEKGATREVACEGEIDEDRNKRCRFKVVETVETVPTSCLKKFRRIDSFPECEKTGTP